MLLLAVDRSSASSGAALFRDGACLAERTARGDPARAPAWMADIRDLLARAGLSVGQLDGLAVGLGPGSFSGTRAAVAGLQGLGLPRGIPLAGVSSASALAWRVLQTAPCGSRVAVVGDARRERLWTAAFERGVDGRLAVVGVEGRLRPPSHADDDFQLVLASKLAAAIPAGAKVLSPDWDRIETRLREQLDDGLLVAGCQCPTAGDVARLVVADRAGARSDPVPVYLHPPVGAAVPRERGGDMNGQREP